MDLISRKLQEAKISHQCYHTGNTGRHILAKFEDLHNYGLGERQWLKREIIRLFADGYNIDLLKTSSKTLIQMPDTPHRKTGKEKRLISEHYYGENKIPQGVIFEMLGKRVGQVFKKDSNISLKISSPVYCPPCYKRLEEMNIPTGNRDNVLFLLLNEWTRRYSKEEAWAKALDFVNRHDSFIGIESLSKKFEAAQRQERECTCRYKKKIIEQMGMKELCVGCMFE
jgi:hypothetical protein